MGNWYRLVICIIALISGSCSKWSLQAGLDAYERQDPATAFRLLKPWAERGNASAQVVVGFIYYFGQKDCTEGVKWFQKAAEQGDKEAQGMLGWAYSDGKGVPQNYSEAAGWFRKSAEQGNAVSQNKLGGMYEAGKGVPKDYAEAARWYLRAAAQGNNLAQQSAGRMYERGLGVSRDLIQAHLWFNLASAYYDIEFEREEAVEARDRVAAKMSPQQLAKSQALAAEWKPRKE